MDQWVSARIYCNDIKGTFKGLCLLYANPMNEAFLMYVCKYFTICYFYQSSSRLF